MYVALREVKQLVLAQVVCDHIRLALGRIALDVERLDQGLSSVVVVRSLRVCEAAEEREVAGHPRRAVACEVEAH